MPAPAIEIVPDPKSLALTAARKVTEIANQSISARNSFSIALSGGGTPKALLELLAGESFSRQIDWRRWEIYWGDERTVPPDHPDSNFGMAKKALLDRVPIPSTNIFRMKGEIDPNQSAIEYGQHLKQKFVDSGMDLILLGMGDDGHTASLFPETTALAETHHRCVANFVPKLNVWRITLSAPFINKSRNVLALIAGAAKTDRVKQILKGPKDPIHLPIQLIEPAGKYSWLLDQAAAAGL